MKILYTCLFIFLSLSLFGNGNLKFVENVGQTISTSGEKCAQVKFTTSSGNGNIFFLNNGFSWVNSYANPKDDESFLMERIDLVFVNTEKSPILLPQKPTEERFNHYSLNKSITNLVEYECLTYKDLFQGVDLLFHSNELGLKYDFVILPESKKTVISWKYEGAKELEITEKGELVVHTEFGAITESIPKVYFEEAPTLSPPNVRYVLLDKFTVRLVIENYVEMLTLVVDPLATWATYIGGTGSDYGHGLAKEGNNLYLAGETQSFNFPTTPGVTQVSAGGSRDAFIAKFTTSGNRQWTTFFGGSGSDVGEDIAVRGNDVYLAGHSTGNLPVTMGAHKTTYGGNTDGFLAKFDANGILQWATYYGGSSEDECQDVAVDNLGNIVITGLTSTTQNNTDDIATAGAFQTSKAGNEDAFIAKFNSSGTRTWGTYVGGNDTERSYNVATDSNNDIVITGETYGGSSFSEFPTGAASGYTAFQTTQGGGFGDKDAFVFKLNSTGTSMLFSTFYGGDNIERGYGVAVDPSDNIIITGNVDGNNLPVTLGAAQYFWGGGGNWGNSDAFIVKFNALGERQWATYYGGNNYDLGFSVDAPNDDKIIIVGETASSNLPTPATCLSCSSSSFCGFVAQINSNGTTIEFASYLGGSGSFNSGQDVQGDVTNDLFVTGYTNSTDYPVGGNTFQASNGGGVDAFLGLLNSVDCQSLPLELVSFKATLLQNNDVLFDWSTLNEEGLSHFDLEKSVNGINFEKFATTSAMNNSSFQYRHQANNLWDKNIYSLYFRLKMVDLDGSITFSELAQVTKGKPILITVFPNPAKEELNIEWDLSNERNLALSLMDIHGHLVKTLRDKNDSSTDTNFSLVGLVSGTYLLKITNNGQTFYRKIVLLN